MLTELWNRILLSADLGADGGSDLGGSVDTVVDDAGEGAEGVEGAEGAAAATQGPDWNGLGSKFGGYEGVQQGLQHWQMIQERIRTDPAFREAYYGQQARQQQEKPQTEHPLAWMSYKPEQSSALRDYHRQLRQASEIPDPQERAAALQALRQDPMYQDVAKDYSRHQQVMGQKSYWEPVAFQKDLMTHPELQQIRQQEIQQSVAQARQEIQQQYDSFLWGMISDQYSDRFNALPETVKQAYMAGGYGKTGLQGGTIQEALAALKKAIAEGGKAVKTGAVGGGGNRPINGQVDASRTGKNGLGKDTGGKKTSADTENFVRAVVAQKRESF